MRGEFSLIERFLSAFPRARVPVGPGDDCAVVCVLHDLNLAAQYAHRIVVLDKPVKGITPARLPASGSLSNFVLHSGEQKK